MDIAKDASVLPCGHTFCRECITQSRAYGVTHYDQYGRRMVSDRQPCPTCRHLAGNSDHKVYALCVVAEEVHEYDTSLPRLA